MGGAWFPTVLLQIMDIDFFEGRPKNLGLLFYGIVESIFMLVDSDPAVKSKHKKISFCQITS